VLEQSGLKFCLVKIANNYYGRVWVVDYTSFNKTINFISGSFLVSIRWDIYCKEVDDIYLSWEKVGLALKM
jgi:hypothetical protein